MLSYFPISAAFENYAIGIKWKMAMNMPGIHIYYGNDTIKEQPKPYSIIIEMHLT